MECAKGELYFFLSSVGLSVLFSITKGRSEQREASIMWKESLSKVISSFHPRERFVVISFVISLQSLAVSKLALN